MAISSTDILFKLSTTVASSGNSVSGVPSGSLGKYISTTVIDTGVPLNNLFDNISGDENAASDVEYRCAFIHNSHASLTYQTPVIWVSAEVSGGASVAIGVDPTAASAIGTSSVQAVTVADESTAPSGVTFSTPVTKASGLSLGNLAAGQCKAFWIRRTAANTTAKSNDGATISVAGDSDE